MMSKRPTSYAVIRGKVIDTDLIDTDIAEWASDVLGLGNLVRSARLNFRETRFFFTASVMTGEVMHESIPALMRWVLDGIDLGAS